MSLENEFFQFKDERKHWESSIEKVKDLDVESMAQDQVEARERVMKNSKKEIEEIDEILEEIKVELYDFIHDGGEVSEKTLSALISDLKKDSENAEDDYDKEVLIEKVNFLNSL